MIAGKAGNPLDPGLNASSQGGGAMPLMEEEEAPRPRPWGASGRFTPPLRPASLYIPHGERRRRRRRRREGWSYWGWLAESNEDAEEKGAEIV